MRQAIAGQQLQRPYIGIHFVQIDAQVKKESNLPVAEGAWVVRTDDDVVVDPEWLAAIAEAATSGPGVECVTGVGCVVTVVLYQDVSNLDKLRLRRFVTIRHIARWS